jgi:hypothetical protein
MRDSFQLFKDLSENKALLCLQLFHHTMLFSNAGERGGIFFLKSLFIHDPGLCVFKEKASCLVFVEVTLYDSLRNSPLERSIIELSAHN